MVFFLTDSAEGSGIKLCLKSESFPFRYEPFDLTVSHLWMEQVAKEKMASSRLSMVRLCGALSNQGNAGTEPQVILTDKKSVHYGVK